MILDGASKIGILGFGREGLSVYDFLLRDYSDLEIHVFDKRELAEFPDDIRADWQANGVVLHLGEGYLEDLEAVDLLVKSPGVNPRQPEIVRFLGLGGRYTTATNLFFERVSAKVIGITGSKGKSTTSTLIYEALLAVDKQAFLVGNIGEPILNYLEFDSPEVYFVVEMSSQQLEDFEGRVDYALFTSFFADHMDYHGGMEAYVSAKVNLFKNAKLTLFNGDDHVVSQILKEHGILARAVQKYGLSFVSSAQLHNSLEQDFGCAINLNGLPFLNFEEVKLKGHHNMKNMMLVTALFLELGLDQHILQQVFYKFNGLAHRMQVLDGVDKVVVNDSASVTPESSMACLEAYENYDQRVIVLGGMDRGYDYTILNQVLTERDVVVIMPNLHSKVVEQVSVCPVREVLDLKDAVDVAWQICGIDGVILFSPGAPSYNVFKNFYQRGDAFVDLISNL